MNNYKFKTTNIRGKQYVEVNERIKFFRQEKQYQNWTISTEFTVLNDDQCVCKCIVADEQQRVIATGHAHELKASSHINKTSYVENCETSAVGRALAMLGIGIDVSIASANEVQDAIAKQNAPKKAKKAESVDAQFDKAVAYLKKSDDKADAWSKIEKQSRSKFSKEEIDVLLELIAQ